jgi:hypothetical protein
MLEARAWRAREEHQQHIAGAWYTAGLVGAMFAGKLPPLGDLLAPHEDAPAKKLGPAKVQQTAEQMVAAMKMVTAQVVGFNEGKARG